MAELRASRERLALAADADRRGIERTLHDGPQQHLVALAANLQLARRLADSDPDAVNGLLEEMGRDVQLALRETATLACTIYPPLLEAGGLAAALRAAAVTTGITIRLAIEADAVYPPEVAGAMYFCCLEVFELAGAGAHVTVTVRTDGGTVAFDVEEDSAGSPAPDAVSVLVRSRDRIEALAGRLATYNEPQRGTRVSGWLPLSR